MSIYPPTGTLEIKNATLKIPVVDLQYTSNTAKLEANSNVVTEFSRSKKLIKYPRVNLTQNALNNGYAAEASTEKDGIVDGQAYRVFDGVFMERGYHSANSSYSSGTYSLSNSITDFYDKIHNGEWIKLQMPTTEKMQLRGFTFHPRNDSGSSGYAPYRIPLEGGFLGSTDGNNWYPIHYFYNFGMTNGSIVPSTKHFEPTNHAYYNHIAVVAYKLQNHSSGSVFNFAELELFGIPEYDPDADGTDVTLKSLANVPNTDWLEIYYDAKGLPNGAVTNPISGLGGTTNEGTAVGDTQVSNGAFVFDGSGDYIYNSQSGYTSGTMYTGCAWIKKASATNGCIFQFGTGSNYDGFGLFSFGSPTETKTMRAFVYGGADADYTGDVPLNEWFHVVVVIYNTDATLYLNGVEVATDTRTTAITIPSTPYLSLGVQTDSGNTPYSSTYFDGSIANFRLFNRALSQDEIYQLYAYQKEEFGHSTNNLTLKAGRLGIGTSEPRAALDVKGRITREYNPGEIIETIQGKANGRYVKVQSGTYLLQNVGTYQDLTNTHTRITGSNFEYTPPPGTTRVIYEFWCFIRQGDPRPIIHFQGRVDGTIVNDSRHTYRDTSATTEHDPQKWIYNHMCVSIGEVTSDNIAGGQVATWNGPRTIDFTAREYNDSYEGRLHKTNHWDGSSSDILVRPTIKITAIA